MVFVCLGRNKANKMTWSLAATLLLLSGDVELNPGPKKGAPKDTGPTPDQKIAELETTIKTYEEKITGNWAGQLLKRAGKFKYLISYF